MINSDYDICYLFTVILPLAVAGPGVGTGARPLLTK